MRVLLLTGEQHCWSCAKGIIWKTLLCWCKINAVGLGWKCFHKDCHCTLKAAGSAQACVFVSWHSSAAYMHSHTHVMDLCSILSRLLHSLGFSTHKRKYPSSQVWDKCSRKEGKRQIAKRKEEPKGKWLLVCREKREGALQPEWGVHLICNYPPDEQPMFEVDWLPGRKF